MRSSIVNLKCLTFCLACASLAACATSPRLAARESELRASPDPYVKRSLEAFTTYELSNGVPVIVRRNASNRVSHVRLVVKGGSLGTPAEKAGIGGLTLRTMSRASKAAPYEDIARELDATSSSFSVEPDFDATAYSLNTLDKYFAKLFPLWLDTIVNPRLDETDFEKAREDALMDLEGIDQDPWRKVSRVLNESFFKDHPYAVTFDGTEESLGGLTLEDARREHGLIADSGRVFVIAVGAFDEKALIAGLEATIGKFPKGKYSDAASVPSFGGKIASGLIKVEEPQSKGIGYLRGDFPAPAPDSADFMATNVGMKMFSDLLFDIVRDKYNAVYTPGAYIRAARANYGSITIFKTSSGGGIKSYVDEAFSPMLAGQCLSVQATGEEDHPRQAIADALPSYLAQYKNETFERGQTNAAIAAQIQGSVIHYGDGRYFLLDGQRIDGVTADAVREAMKRHVAENQILWAMLGSKDVIDAAKEDDYSSTPRQK